MASLQTRIYFVAMFGEICGLPRGREKRLDGGCRMRGGFLILHVTVNHPFTVTDIVALKKVCHSTCIPPTAAPKVM